MDASKDSPLPADGPLNHAPLAPSQEAAYRKKCIQLKKRLQEIESDNDAKRRRIEREKQHVQKMRLNRAILLDHLKRTMEAPAVKLTPEQLARIGIIANGAGHPAEFAGPHPSRAMADNEGLLDDSSDESEEEPEVHIPLPRPSNPFAPYPVSMLTAAARRETPKETTSQPISWRSDHVHQPYPQYPLIQRPTRPT